MSDSVNFTDEEIVNSIVERYSSHFTPVTLMKHLNPRFIVNPMHKFIGMKIRDTILRDGGNLIISAPPRVGKSETGNVGTSVWALDCFPDKRILLACTSMTLAKSFGRRIRNIFKAFGSNGTGQLRNSLKADAKSSGEFYIDNEDEFAIGGLYCLGVDSSVIGRGGDIFILDDYIKDAQSALNPKIHDDNWEWWNNTFSHRGEPGASKIIVATRWHQEDLIGRILQEEPEEWEYVELPAIACENDILGREPGEVLFPQRFGNKFYEKQKRKMGFFYDAVFQQRPRKFGEMDRKPEDIEIIDYEDLPQLEEMKFCRFWDLGGGTDNRHDPTVGGLFGWHMATGNFYILDIWRKKAEPGVVEKTVKDLAVRDIAIWGHRYIIGLEQEGGASGKYLTAHWENMLQGFNIEAATSNNKAKVTRAIPFLGAVDMKAVKMLRAKSVSDGKNWNQIYLDEYVDFPSVKHDDQMDVSSGAYNILSKMKRVRITWGYDGAQSDNGLPKTSVTFGNYDDDEMFSGDYVDYGDVNG